MEIKQTVLPPYGGSREEMGGGASAWTYGRGVIGSPGAEDNRIAVPNVIGLGYQPAYELILASGLTYFLGGPELQYGMQPIVFQLPAAGTLVGPGSQVEIQVAEIPDLTISPAFVSYSAPGWCFGVQGDQIPPISPGDRVVASGFNVIDQIDQNGNRTPNGLIDVNGEWTIDQVVDQNSGQYTLFSSPALRSEIGELSTNFASSFGNNGTIQIYDDARTFSYNGTSYGYGTLSGSTTANPGKIVLPYMGSEWLVPILDGSPWEIRINNLSTTYTASAELGENDLELTPQESMNSEFNSTITGAEPWIVDGFIINSFTGILTIYAYYP
jgi:hypothetical protein